MVRSIELRGNDSWDGRGGFQTRPHSGFVGKLAILAASHYSALTGDMGLRIMIRCFCRDTGSLPVPLIQDEIIAIVTFPDWIA